MAVYTRLNRHEIENFLIEYDLGKLSSFDEMIDGIDNSTFVIKTNSNKFILTIFEGRIKENDLDFFVNLKKHLKKKNFSCPNPISNKKGKFINFIQNKPSILVSFLNGKSIKSKDHISLKNMLDLGMLLAEFHLKTKDFSKKLKNNLGWKNIKNLYLSIRDKTLLFDSKLAVEIDKYFDFVEKNNKNNLKKCIIHGDLFHDNVFFDKDGEISGMIDFYFSCNDILIYDIAITITAWCFNEKGVFIKERYYNFIDGYSKIRKLQKEEIVCLRISLIISCMRFLITRLVDYFKVRVNAISTTKDPMEYYNKLKFFDSEFSKFL